MRVLDYIDDHTVRRAYDSDQNEQYFAMAAQGSAESDEVWQIRLREYDSNLNEIAVKWPKRNGNPSSEFLFAWSQRTSYTYA